ncbi:cation:proton antiporter [uncultured Ruegeria sp.]|uniref:cation:proton antiporter domain-containing protein n=1 Tax=uncultured Ruegeria sp. TaxID=259304 RepID=UPI00262CD05A|nr:cation:proton antiporter [uncultured Ruegeria sp.]
MNEFLYQATVYLFAAVLTVSVLNRVGLGSVLGYLLAGVVIGPIFGLVGPESESLQHVAEFGVVMMLFLIGLSIAPIELWNTRYSLLGLGGSQIIFTTVVIMLLTSLAGHPWSVSLAVALTLCLSSTAIVLQTLSETSQLHSSGGRAAFSVLLMQDFAVIPILAFLPLLALPPLPLISEDGSMDRRVADFDEYAHGNLSLIEGLPGWGVTMITIGAVAFIILFGRFFANPLFRFVSTGNKREMQTALALSVVVGISFLMSLVGLPPALGAFVAGLVLANSDFRDLIDGVIQPFKSLFMGLFFITVGAGIDVGLFFSDPLNFLALALLLIVVKGIILLVLGYFYQLPSRDLWIFTIGLAQAGEFGFVLLAFSTQQNVIPPDLSQKLLMVIALTMLMTPIFLALTRPVTRLAIGSGAPIQHGRIKVFISYSRDNKEEMEDFKIFLESQRFEVIYDSRNIPFGEEWKKELRYLIEQADVVIWLISPPSIKSYWCNWELRQIEELKKKLVPIFIEDVPLNLVPKEVRARQIMPGSGCFNLESRDHKISLAQLLASDYDWIKYHTRLGDRARVWDDADRSADRLLTEAELQEAEEWYAQRPHAAPEPTPVIDDFIQSSRLHLHGNMSDKNDPAFSTTPKTKRPLKP